MPIWLQDNDRGIVLAENVIAGTATKWLPIIYISATGQKQWAVPHDDVEKLAYDMGGIAHVVVEPNRTFSLRLRDQSKGRNLYGGTIGIALPHRGFVRRLYMGWQIETWRELLDAVKYSAIELRGHMPSVGWDWTELQEKILRNQRVDLRSALLKADAEELFDSFSKQVEDLEEENRQLKEQLISQAAQDLGIVDAQFVADNLPLRVGKEIYPGELYDRIRLAAQIALTVAESSGIDDRSKAVWALIVQRVPRSPALDELLQDLSRATKDPKRVAGGISDLLQRHGYRCKADNKHVRLEPELGYAGLNNLTIPKTPSDHRGLKNLCKQVEHALGIGKLPRDIGEI
jgi:hypothetical protein